MINNNTTITWILIADAALAKLYSAKNIRGEWSLVQTFDNPAAHEQDQDLVADKFGSYKAPMEPGGSAFDERTDPKRAEIDQFGRHLANVLREGRTRNAYQRLILVAPPRFQGIVKKHCDAHTEQCFIHHLAKDYVHLPEREMIPLIQQQL